MKGMGIALWVFGLLLYGIALFIPTTVPGSGGIYGGGEVNNIGLMQNQMILVQSGLALFVAGVLLHGLGEFARTLTQSTISNGGASSISQQSVERADLPTESSPHEPTEAEVRFAEDMRLHGITRAPGGGYRYGRITYETVEHAVKGARRGDK